MTFLLGILIALLCTSITVNFVLILELRHVQTLVTNECVAPIKAVGEQVKKAADTLAVVSEFAFPKVAVLRQAGKLVTSPAAAQVVSSASDRLAAGVSAMRDWISNKGQEEE